MAKSFDVCVIGSGPGGYVAAIRASQLGFKTAIIEKRDLGGVCLNIGCIPTKALLKSAETYDTLKHAADYGVVVEKIGVDFEKIIKRSRGVADKMSKGVQFLMKANKVEVFKGHGQFASANEVQVMDENGKEIDRIQAQYTIIATGARSRELPHLKIDGDAIINSEQAMKMKEQPKRMVVIGAGAIGIEFAYFYHTIGTEVTVVEIQKTILPVEDEEVGKELAKIYKKAGMNILTESSVEKVEKKGKNVLVTVKTPKGTETIETDVVLSAVGIAGNHEGLNLDKIGVEVDRGMIKGAEYRPGGF